MTGPANKQSYAVELYFDAAAEAAIRALREILLEIGISPSPRLLDSRPHLSLAVLEAARTDLLLAAVRSLATAPPLQLNFGAVGSFAGDGHVLFLAPAPTAELLNRQRALHTLLNDLPEAQVWNHYLPDRWTPHCTLEMEIAAERLPDAFAAVRSALTPISALTEELGVVGFPQLRSLGSFELRP